MMFHREHKGEQFHTFLLQNPIPCIPYNPTSTYYKINAVLEEESNTTPLPAQK